MLNTHTVLYCCIVITLFGFSSCNKDISTTPADPPVSTGKIVFNSEPQGAEIFVNEDNTARFTPDSVVFLEPGKYHITMRLYPYLDIEDSVIVQNDSSTIVIADFFGDTRNFGSITVNSIPTNAQIYLRDSLLDVRTPAVFNQLWPGLYNIACTFPEHRKKQSYVLIRGGESKSTTVVMQDTSIFVDYIPSNSDFPSIQSLCIAIDQNNTKWVGLSGTGLVRFRETSTVKYNSSNSELPNNFVSCIVVDDQNNKWIGTHKGLVIIDNNNNWRVFTTENSNIPHDHITAIAFDSENNVWIGATDPIVAQLLLKFDGTEWSSYNAGNIITALAVDHSDRIWVGRNNGFLILENGNWINIVPGLPPTHHLRGNPIESIAVDYDGNVWVVAGGISRGFSYTPGGLYVFINDIHSQIDLPENLISHIHISPDGNKWISCLGRYPLDFIEDTRIILMKLDNMGNLTSYSKANCDLPAAMLRASDSQSNGDLWIATRDKGIVKYKGANL
ncbi:two-component regulator propeller domain-containing protein [Bacteroidota bacterium]